MKIIFTFTEEIKIIPMNPANPFHILFTNKVLYQGPYFVIKISPLQQNKTEQQLLQERDEKNAALNAFYKGINRTRLSLL